MGGFHIENFGCRAARSDGEAVSERLRAGGMWESDPQAADVVVVNTCSVTAEADRSARAYIRKAHRLNPAARILVTGCYAQRAPEELASLPGVSAVIGNSHKALAPAMILQSGYSEVASAGTAKLDPVDTQSAGNEPFSSMVRVGSLLANQSRGTAPIWVDDQFAHSFLEDAQLLPGAQTRPNLKIQEGCSNRCTFCVIPQTRGSSRSLAPEKVLAQVQGFVAAGGKELVFSGINLGRWGRDLVKEGPELQSLSKLVRAIFRDTDLPRLRLSSIEPMDWDEELIGVMREFGGTRLARHAHLPLQSGSDSVLRRMHRRYRPWHYARKIAALCAVAGPELTVGADVMVGFPGETDREFEESCEFLRSLPFAYFHLFPFSPRPGTRGWKMHQEAPVPADVTERRMEALRGLAAQKTEAHRRAFLGASLPAITLQSHHAVQVRGMTSALTDNFLPVMIDSQLAANSLVEVRVTGITSDLTLTARIES